MADIRGCDFNGATPTVSSSAYRPVCLFYCNDRIIQETIQDPSSEDQVVTLDDYTFEEEEEGYEEEMTDILDAVCKHCLLSESVDDVNTILHSVRQCNFGVHQPREKLPDRSRGIRIDPRHCSVIALHKKAWQCQCGVSTSENAMKLKSMLVVPRSYFLRFPLYFFFLLRISVSFSYINMDTVNTGLLHSVEG